MLLDNQCNLKSYDSAPNVSTPLSSVFIKGDLKLLRDSFNTLTNEPLFLLIVIAASNYAWLSTWMLRQQYCNPPWSNKLMRVNFHRKYITKLSFWVLAIRRHFPIRLRSWGFQRWPFVVTCQSDYEADVLSVGPSSSLSDKITKLTFRAWAFRQSKSFATKCSGSLPHRLGTCRFFRN